MSHPGVPSELRKGSMDASRRSLGFGDIRWKFQHESDGAWYESQDDVLKGLIDGECKRRLLDWVRDVMADRLTRHQRECVQLYYFLGLSCRQMAAIRGINKSTANVNVRRGVRKIRASWDARDCPIDVVKAAHEYTGRCWQVTRETDYVGSNAPVHDAQPT